MDPIVYSMEADTPFERAYALTLSGEATCYLIKLRRLLVEMRPADRAQVLGELQDMLDTLDKAA